MSNFNSEFHQLHSKEIDSLPSEFVQVLDWFVLEGAETDEVIIMQEEIHNLRLGEIDYYVGPPTCWDDSHYLYVSGSDRRDECSVEIGALAALGAPYEDFQLNGMVEYIKHDVDKHFMDIEVSEDSSGTVWLFRRFTKAQLASEEFHNMMSYFVGVSKEVRSAVFSGGY